MLSSLILVLWCQTIDSHVKGCCRWALRFSGQMFCHKSAKTQALYSAPASILSGTTTANQCCTSSGCTNRITAIMHSILHKHATSTVTKSREPRRQTTWQFATAHSAVSPAVCGLVMVIWQPLLMPASPSGCCHALFSHPPVSTACPSRCQAEEEKQPGGNG